MPEEDNAVESSAESLSSTSQSSESDMVTYVADVVETSVASFPGVSQPLNEPDTGARETTASFSTVLQPKIPISNAAVEKLLDTSPAKVKIIELY